MNILRWIGLSFLILVLGYLSGLALFADGSMANLLTAVGIFLVGCAAVGAQLPKKYWYITGICGWGGMLMVILELSTRISNGPVAGAQSTMQLLFTFFIVLGLALVGGFMGSRLRKNTPNLA